MDIEEERESRKEQYIHSRLPTRVSLKILIVITNTVWVRSGVTLFLRTFLLLVNEVLWWFLRDSV